MKEIIIVDDDDMNNYVCETMILKLIPTVKVLSFSNPVKALHYLTGNNKKVKPIVLLDINMPEMSGWQFIELLKKNKILVSLIMLTSSISFQDKETALGIEELKDFFVKPITTTLIDKIKELI